MVFAWKRNVSNEWIVHNFRSIKIVTSVGDSSEKDGRVRWRETEPNGKGWTAPAQVAKVNPLRFPANFNIAARDTGYLCALNWLSFVFFFFYMPSAARDVHDVWIVVYVVNCGGCLEHFMYVYFLLISTRKTTRFDGRPYNEPPPG